MLSIEAVVKDQQDRDIVWIVKEEVVKSRLVKTGDSEPRISAKLENVQKPQISQKGYDQSSPVDVKSILWTDTEQNQTITRELTSKT